MKNFIVTIAIVIILAGCQEENETVYSIDSALDPYVSTFYAEAAERGVVIPKNLIGEIKLGQSMVETYTQHNQNYLYFQPTSFDYYIKRNEERFIEAHVYNRLGGLFLKRSPILAEDSLSFMNPKIRFGGYDPVNKEILFDELFKER